jgi:hypothetical protein
MGAAARARVAQHFTQAGMASSYVDVLHTVIQSRARPAASLQTSGSR